MTRSAVRAAAEGEFAVMGIVNVTPDSFSDGGLYLDPATAIDHGLELESGGASILDVGGESTRPGAMPVAAAEELRRVVPVIEGLRAAGADAQISIDTSKAAVASAALAAGATLVNDVTALRGDPAMAELVAGAGADCCLMHMLGEPRTMQQDPQYRDVVDEVKAFLEQRLGFAVSRGINEARIMLDPGIGFGKTTEHNLELLRRLHELLTLGRPVGIGTSRKSFLGRITARPLDDRIAATIATNVLAYERGARVFRVHDVTPVHDALAITAATVRPAWASMTPTSSTMSTTQTRATRKPRSPR
ncbi:MAG: dihydropteroate synthase [Candidatus Dormiibacterota bacterium]